MSKYDTLIKIYNERGNDYYTPLDLTIPYLKENLGQHPGKVLDLGCGSGKVLRHVMRFQPSRVVGVDFAEARIAHARNEFPDAEFHCSEIYDYLQKCNDKFDIVLLFEVLEHVFDDVEIIKAIPIICPNGMLLASTPINMPDECHVRIFSSAEEIVDRYNLCNYEERMVRGSRRIVFRKDTENGQYKDLQS